MGPIWVFNIRAAGFYVLIPSYSSNFEVATSIWPNMGVCPDHPFESDFPV